MTGHAPGGIAFFFPGFANVTVATFPSRSTCTCAIAGTILTLVGLNPFRQHRASTADILLVAAALVVCVALVAWAFFG
jgi:ABC-type cobalamin transport system permease subunit